MLQYRPICNTRSFSFSIKITKNKVAFALNYTWRLDKALLKTG